MVWIHQDHRAKEADQLVIECNYCNFDESVFFQGGAVDAPESNWMAIAASHMIDSHQRTMLDLSKSS